MLPRQFPYGEVVIFSLGVQALTLCRIRHFRLELPVDPKQGHQVL